MEEQQQTQIQEPKKVKPIWKRWWFWIIAVFFILSVISSPTTEKKPSIEQVVETELEITQPSQPEVEKKTEDQEQQPATKKETQVMVLLSGGGSVALMTTVDSMVEYKQKMKDSILKGDIDELTRLTEEYTLEIPNNTKALVLGEEIALPPDPEIGPYQTEFFVKVKIAEGKYKDKVGWVNRRDIKIITGTPTELNQKSQVREEWKTVKTYQGTGNQEKLEPVAINHPNWRFKIYWEWEEAHDYWDLYGIYRCEDETGSFCYLFLRAFHIPGKQTLTITPLFREYESNTGVFYFKTEADSQTKWIIEIQIL